MSLAGEQSGTAGEDRARQGTLMRRATYASVTVASILIVAKLVAWLMTGSVAMLSTLIDSLLDAAASLINLFAVRQALTPPDREHRFGHGKAEPLAALAQAGFIAGSAIFLVIEAGQRLYRPQSISASDVGIGVMILAIVLTLVLVRYQRYVIRHTKSLAISADSLHYVGDLLVNVAVIGAIILVTEFGLLLADPIFAFAIAAYILWNAASIARGALGMLMDRELGEEERQTIKTIVASHPEVIDLHDLRTRAAGPQIFIQLHLELDGSLSLWKAHEIADAVEMEILEAFPDAEVLIHEDPAGVDESHVRPASGEPGAGGEA